MNVAELLKSGINTGHVGRLTADERLMRDRVVQQLKAQVSEVHAAVLSGKKSNAVNVDTRGWDDSVIMAVRPVWFTLFKRGGDRALSNVRKFSKSDRKMVTLDAETINKAPIVAIEIPDWIEDPQVLAAIEREMFRFAHSINGTTADMLREELLDGMSKGESINQLANRISSISDEWIEGYRSERIARTESARAFSTGHVEAWRGTGVVDRKVWVAAGDACPFCIAMNGTVVDLDENFLDVGDTQSVTWRGNRLSMTQNYSDVNGPPLHPNCRCAVVGQLSEEAEEKMVRKGGPGSGNFGHRGRPGEVGGSGEGGAEGGVDDSSSTSRRERAIRELPDTWLSYDDLRSMGLHEAISECSAKGLSKQETVAVLDTAVMYTGMGYQDINGNLRGTSDFQPVANQARSVLLDHFVRDICPSTDEDVLYRGIDNFDINYKTGSVIEDPGFLSLTRNVETAQNFSTKGGIVLVISKVKGRAADLTKVGLSGKEEAESILPPRTRLKINSDRESDGYLYIFCEVEEIGPRVKQAHLPVSKKMDGKKADGKERFSDNGFVLVDEIQQDEEGSEK